MNLISNNSSAFVNKTSVGVVLGIVLVYFSSGASTFLREVAPGLKYLASLDPPLAFSFGMAQILQVNYFHCQKLSTSVRDGQGWG